MSNDMQGHRVPDVTFRTRKDHEWVERSSSDVFAGKSVIVFSLPGAFKPWFKANGIDEVICVSVNDAFVMNEWQHAQSADRLTFLPYGNGDFTEGMGQLVDKQDLGFGKRSWRYSMLVRDGVIEKMFIESDVPGDPFSVSDADTMLSYIDPNAGRPHDVTVFSRPGCAFCVKAKGLLRDAGIEFEELVLNRDYTDQTLRAVADATTYPQVFVDGALIGGADDLEKWLQAGVGAAA
jgi:glutaredoxin-like protein